LINTGSEQVGDRPAAARSDVVVAKAAIAGAIRQEK
jgi:hypothetical protein